jgi:hypothetical protein
MLTIVGGNEVGRLWTPDCGPSGLLLICRPTPLSAVLGGRIVEVNMATRSLFTSRRASIEGGLILMSTTRKKEPTRVVGHPELASGASVQRGDTLYVSIAEAVYRESRGEEIELHFVPTADDEEALRDLRVRARNRWENDRLPDGWTRPLPRPTPKTAAEGELTAELRAVREELRARLRERED